MKKFVLLFGTVLLVTVEACAGKPPGNCPSGSESSWSSDFLVQAVIAGECPLRADDFRKEYLARLGIVEKKPDLRERLFRALAAEEVVFEELKRKLKGVSGSHVEILKRAYGSVHWVRQIAVVGATSKEAALLETSLSELCPSMPCAFWDPKYLYKVVVSPLPDLAAYLPELAQLVLSKAWVSKKIVVAHELTHVAVVSKGLGGQREFASEELLADYVALFLYHPDRLCAVDKRPKYDWVRRNFFPATPALKCP